MKDSIVIREFRRGDDGAGLADCLAFFSDTPGPDMATGERLLDVMYGRREAGHPVFVAVDGGEVVGTASCHVERKLIHGGALAGYIEDVAVRRDRRGEGIGEALVAHCKGWLRAAGCYKAVLDCEAGLVPFYERCGLYLNGFAMRADL